MEYRRDVLPQFPVPQSPQAPARTVSDLPQQPPNFGGLTPSDFGGGGGGGGEGGGRGTLDFAPSSLVAGESGAGHQLTNADIGFLPPRSVGVQSWTGGGPGTGQPRWEPLGATGIYAQNPNPVLGPEALRSAGMALRSGGGAPAAAGGGQGGNEPPESIHASANSTGGTGFGSTPDFSSNPELLGALMKAMDNYVYSVPAGGYISKADAENANSYYNKFGSGGGGDPRANQVMAKLYGEVGNLPTRPVETRALAKLYGSGAAQRPAATGPSYNETLAQAMQDPLAREFLQNTGGQYQGPWQFGQRMPYYNQWGQYHPPPM